MSDNTPMYVDSESAMKAPEMPAALPVGHHLPKSDPDNPMNWPIAQKIYTSLASFFFAASAAFSITAYSVAIPEVMKEFKTSMPVAILGMSLYLFGVFFAPIHTPHWSERYGRKPVYLISIFISILFLIGASRSMTWTSLAVCRFFAGFFGGPSLVLIEGTFADIWSADTTNTYYSFLAASANIGAGLGPIILGFVVPGTSWRWTQYASLIFMGAAFIFGIGMPETYPREIVRTRAKRAGRPHNLPKAESGVTILEMAKVTVIDPAVMLVSEPIVIMSSILLGANFGFLFQWFITVPVALQATYNFSIQRVGLAFTAALGGTALALATAILFDQFFHHMCRPSPSSMKPVKMMEHLENRLWPAMVGVLLMVAALFWVANSAKPSVNYAVPIIGTAVYVWGSMLVVIGIVAYLFDAYPPRGTLAALTAAACFRIAMAGVVPLFVIQAFMMATPMWTLMAFGFVLLGLSPVPFVLYFFGERMRGRSRYGHGRMMTMGTKNSTAGSTEDMMARQ